jgi:hypothetical protein
MTVDKLSVYDCIVAVSRDLAAAGIAKSRSNAQQGYKFRGIDDVLNALSPLLAKYKLVILPRILSRTVVERATQKGGVLFYVVVEAEFDFVSAADGTTHTVKMYGEAMDSADKATNKAMSAAYKYAALQTFCIPTEVEDADAVTPEPLAPMAVVTPEPTAPTQHPSGYLAWLQTLRGTAMFGTDALTRAWYASSNDFRDHLVRTAPQTWQDFKAIAARQVVAPAPRPS